MAPHDERDDFWDIDKLVPKKKTVIPSFRTAPSAVSYTVSGDEPKKSGEGKINFDAFKGYEAKEDKVYTKGEGSLIKRVTVKGFADKYDFYGSFRKAALLYYDYKTERCDFATFYSYMPQYSQLTVEQKNYYFFWRDAVRHGKYLRSDYSYLYLYAYEILNLPDKIPPNEGIVLLCNLWREYRKSLPRIDSYLSLWVEDYCLVYDLPCPIEHIRPFISEAISSSLFKEFYLCDAEGAGEDGIDSVLAYLSDYDWRKGKFAGGENAELYKKHLLSAMRRVIYTLDLKGAGEKSVALMKRDAFAHSLCTHAVKCKLEVEYTPLGSNDKMRSLVTQSVRYTENKLRALFGIKSRLAVKDLPDYYKSVIDGYFKNLIEAVEKKRRVVEMPEYEKLYSAPTTELSFSGADEIEMASWSTTERLVSEEEEDFSDIPEKPLQKIEEIPAEREEEREDYGLSDSDILALDSLRLGKNVDDATAERINEAFIDNFGDIILESDGENYRIIEDYEEEIGEWLSKIKK